MAKHLDSEKSLDSGILSTIRVSASICESEVHQKPMPPLVTLTGSPSGVPDPYPPATCHPPRTATLRKPCTPEPTRIPRSTARLEIRFFYFSSRKCFPFRTTFRIKKNGLRIKLFLLRVRPGRFLADGKDILIRKSLSILTLAAATRWVRVSARFLCDCERVAGGRPFSFGIPICRAHCMGTHPRARERGWLCPLRGREGVVTEAAGEGARAGARGVEIANAHTGCLAWDQNPVQGARQ